MTDDELLASAFRKVLTADGDPFTNSMYAHLDAECMTLTAAIERVLPKGKPMANLLMTDDGTFTEHAPWCPVCPSYSGPLENDAGCKCWDVETARQHHATA